MHSNCKSRTQDTHVVAFEAAAALEAYEAGVALLARGKAHPWDLARVDAQVRRTCSHCMRLPELSVDAVALLLSHYRLLAELAQPRQAHDSAAQVAQMHQACIERVRRHCRELFLARHLH